LVRKKTEGAPGLLSQPIIFWVMEQAYKRLEGIRQKERLLRSLQRVNAQQVTALYLHDSQHLLYLRRHSCKASH
jgi:hypothetical protein